MTPRRQLHIVIERMARAMCACQNECHPQDGYCAIHWIDFAPAARAAYDELIRIDEERAQTKPSHEPEVVQAKKRMEKITFPTLEKIVDIIA